MGLRFKTGVINAQPRKQPIRDGPGCEQKGCFRYLLSGELWTSQLFEILVEVDVGVGGDG